MRKEYRSDHSTEKHSPTRTQADGHTDLSWVVPKSVQVRGDRTYANSDVNHKINKTIGSVCGYRSESSRKICPFHFRLMHQIGRMIQSFFLRSYFDHSTAFPDLCRQQNWMYFFMRLHVLLFTIKLGSVQFAEVVLLYRKTTFVLYWNPHE